MAPDARDNRASAATSDLAPAADTAARPSSTDSLRLLTEKLTSLAQEGSAHHESTSFEALLRSLSDKSRENVALSVAAKKQQVELARLQHVNQTLTHEAARLAADFDSRSAALLATHHSLSEANAVLVAEKGSLQQANAALERQCGERAAEGARLRQSLSQSQHRIIELEQGRADMHRARADAEAARTQLAAAQQQAAQHHADMADARAERAEMAQRLQAQIDIVESLKQQLTTAKAGATVELRVPRACIPHHMRSRASVTKRTGSLSSNACPCKTR